MKIKEIFEAYDELRHTWMALAADNYSSTIPNVDSAIDKIYNDYTSDKKNAGMYLDQLEKLQTLFLTSLNDDSLWSRVSNWENEEDSKALYQDFVKVEEKLESTINKIKNENNILEDITDFKSSDGQLSAMGSKRKKTRRDSAKSEVEQLMRK